MFFGSWAAAELGFVLELGSSKCTWRERGLSPLGSGRRGFGDLRSVPASGMARNWPLPRAFADERCR